MISIHSVDEFQKAIGGETVAIVKFYTTWCPDCKRLNTFIDPIIAEHPDKTWYEINSEEFPELADRYEVMGAPSLLVYRNGEKIGHLHSKYTKTPEQIREFLANYPAVTN